MSSLIIKTRLPLSPHTLLVLQASSSPPSPPSPVSDLTADLFLPKACRPPSFLPSCTLSFATTSINLTPKLHPPRVPYKEK